MFFRQAVGNGCMSVPFLQCVFTKSLTFHTKYDIIYSNYLYLLCNYGFLYAANTETGRLARHWS